MLSFNLNANWEFGVWNFSFIYLFSVASTKRIETAFKTLAYTTNIQRLLIENEHEPK